MRDFVKIYSTILDSSVWGESKDTRLLWVTMLLSSDQCRSCNSRKGGRTPAQAGMVLR